MRAVVVTDLAGPSAIVVQDVAEPDADGLVLIDVKASGVCFPDLLISYGKYQIRPEPPFVPGTEVAGVVLSAPDDSGFVPDSGCWRCRVSVATPSGSPSIGIWCCPSRTS